MVKFRAPIECTVINNRLSLAQLNSLAADLVSVHQASTNNYVIQCKDQLEAATIDINETWEANNTQCSSAAATKTKTGLEATAALSIADDRSKLFQLATNGKSVEGSVISGVTSSVTLDSFAVTSSAAFTNVQVGDVVTGTEISTNTVVTAKTDDSNITISKAATATNATASLTFTPPSPALIKIGDDSGLTTGTADYPYKTIVFRPYSGGAPTLDQSRWLVFPSGSVEGQVSQSFGLQNQFSYTINIVAFDPDELGYKVLRGRTALLT